jgi:hypothetical protein
MPPNQQPFGLEFVKEHATVVYIEKTPFGMFNIALITLDEPLVIKGAEHWSGYFAVGLKGFLRPEEYLHHVAQGGVHLLATRGVENLLLHDMPRIFCPLHIFNVVVYCLFLLNVLNCIMDPERPDGRYENSLWKFSKVCCRILALPTLKRLWKF